MLVNVETAGMPRPDQSVSRRPESETMRQMGFRASHVSVSVLHLLYLVCYK
jgi:hypothetical protein